MTYRCSPKWPIALGAALALAGCATLVPPLPQAQPDVPHTWPATDPMAIGAPPGEPGMPPASSLGWRDVLVDARLQRLVAQALAHNRDLRVAVLNVERARAQYRIQRADRVPALGASASLERSGGDAPVSEVYSAGVGLSAFELDLFGRVRNLSEAALQQYFAREEHRRAAQVALIGEVTQAALTLAADRSRLAIARDTLTTYEDALRLDERRHEVGAVSGLVLAQARTQVETARADVARYAGQVAADRNALALLVGAPVAEADLPAGFDDPLVALPPLPGGVPSQVLLQRPDIRAAEHVLRSANANIGAARAAFFPTISLTGSAGSVSDALSGLFDAGTRVWRFVPQVSLPIFQGGRLRANLAMAGIDRDIALADYEQAIQAGFRDVADALVLSQTLAAQREAVERLVVEAQRADELSRARYTAGYDSYLVRLDAQRTLYAAQQALIGAHLAEQANRVGLYRALGGQWPDADRPDTAP